jgi:hypothetical protein
MKADKILFGAACLAMGILTYSSMNRENTEPLLKRPNTCMQDTLKLRPNLMKDTVSFSNPDTLKLAQKIIKH